jgi:hypothetical protein
MRDFEVLIVFVSAVVNEQKFLKTLGMMTCVSPTNRDLLASLSTEPANLEH